MTDEQIVPFPSRLPKSLIRKLKAKAERNVRSANAEMIVAIRYYLTGEKPDDAPSAETEDIEADKQRTPQVQA